MEACKILFQKDAFPPGPTSCPEAHKTKKWDPEGRLSVGFRVQGLRFWVLGLGCIGVRTKGDPTQTPNIRVHATVCPTNRDTDSLEVTAWVACFKADCRGMGY